MQRIVRQGCWRQSVQSGGMGLIQRLNRRAAGQARFQVRCDDEGRSCFERGRGVLREPDVRGMNWSIQWVAPSASLSWAVARRSRDFTVPKGITRRLAIWA